MNKPILSAFVIIAFILASCSGQEIKIHSINESKDQTVLKVLKLPESGEDILKASSFADTVIYVPLETNKESFIGSIAQVWINNSVILINNFGGNLLMFQHDGKFLRRIGKNGRGPGEYGIIYHFDVIKDTIYISSSVSRGFLLYDLKGTFCDEIKLNYEPVYFSSTVDHKLACVTVGRYRYSQTLNAGINYLQKTSTGLLFNSFLSDTIWNISSIKKEPAYVLHMKEKLLPYEKQIEFSNGNFENFHKLANPYSLVHLIPFQSMMFVFQLHHTIYADDSGYDAIYLSNTKNSDLKRFNTSYIYDDLVSKQMLSNERFAYFFPIHSSDYLVTSKKPIDVLKFIDQNKGNNKVVPSSLWLNQMKMIKVDDNPILVFVKLKKRIGEEE
jgi:hypothetical protein